uniref:Lysine-specific histone demethylase n=1 Tax=Ditylenchus dipsaci TaxID=166011 RepID=A0A915E9E9_9BILA
MSVFTIKEGYSDIIRELARDLYVELESIVEKVEYDTTGVRVSYHKRNSDKSIVKTTLHADAVICTVPLGILKRCIIPDMSDSISFEPQLPTWKTKVISSLGYGSLNKIALMFEKPFWDTSLHMFGRLNESSASRGEMFLFFSNGDRVKEELLVNKAMAVLANIYGNSCPKKPVSHVVTLWHRDRFAHGCYSFIGTNSSAEDYDVLFFAGEHTNRQYPATVHGAFLSGVRDAAAIADHFIGPAVSVNADSGENSMEESKKEEIMEEITVPEVQQPPMTEEKMEE